MGTIPTLNIGTGTHHILQSWDYPPVPDGPRGAYMAFTACGRTLYPRRDSHPLVIVDQDVTALDCPDCRDAQLRERN